MEPKTRRAYFLDYPSGLEEEEEVTFILSLHGGATLPNWHRHYFPAFDYKDKYRLVIATPIAGSIRWTETDDEYLQNIVSAVYGQFGTKIKAFWLAGHSQGGVNANRLLRTPFFMHRVDGWLSLSGGRPGPSMPIAADIISLFESQGSGSERKGVPLYLPQLPKLQIPEGLPNGDISFIFVTGQHELGGLPIPEESLWATKYAGSKRIHLATIVDEEPGYVYDRLRQKPGADAWGRLPRPGTAQVFVYPNCRDGRLVADVIRFDKGHTEGLEPNITEGIIKLMLSARKMVGASPTTDQ